MRHFFTTKNCNRFVHVVALLCSLLDANAHLHVEHEFETVLGHINHRRSIVR